MGTSLTGLTPATTYDALIKVGDNGPLSATAKYLSDGLGNDSILALSTARVGIGTASPDLTLHLYSAAAALAYFESTNANGAYVIWRNSGTSIGDVGSQLGISGTGSASNFMIASRSGDLILGSSSAERMRITSAGNVGIGTSTPSAKLTVVGTGEYDGVLIVRSTGSGTPQAVMGVDAVGSGFGYVGTVNNIPLQIRTNDVTRLRVDADGLKFGSDTAAANALDDYEEGTFTPTVIGSTTAGTATYTTQVGRYTKIGRQVSVQIDLGYNSGTGTGNLGISGLPFAENQSTNPAVTIGYLDGMTLTANNYAVAYIASLSTRIDIVQVPVGGGALTSVAYDDAGRIILNVTYVA